MGYHVPGLETHMKFRSRVFSWFVLDSSLLSSVYDAHFNGERLDFWFFHQRVLALFITSTRLV